MKPVEISEEQYCKIWETERKYRPFMVLSPEELVEGEEYEMVHEETEFVGYFTENFRLLQKDHNFDVYHKSISPEPGWMIIKHTRPEWEWQQFDYASYADYGLILYANGRWNRCNYTRRIVSPQDIYRRGIAALFRGLQ